MKNCYIGCSGFSYPEWKDRFYPPKWPRSQWLEYYASQFATVEVNMTFYRLPKTGLFESWYARTPACFRFAVKAPKSVTHDKKFVGVADELANFYAFARAGLHDKLGPVLFQLPPRTAYSEAALGQLVGSLDPAFQNVVEFRHASWWRPDVVAALNAVGACFCGVSYPGLPAGVTAGQPFQYVRMHGVPKLYISPYSDAELQAVATGLAGSAVSYVYFNNTMQLAAIANAHRLTELLAY